MTADTTPSLDKALAAWGTACRAWSRDDCTDATRLMKVGEGMMYAAIDYQCALEARAEAAEANARRLSEALRPFADDHKRWLSDETYKGDALSIEHFTAAVEAIELTTKEADRG